MLPHLRSEDCSSFLQELTLVSKLVLSKFDFYSGERFVTLLSSFPNLRHLRFHDTNIWAESDLGEPSNLWRLQHYAKAISLDSLEISLCDVEGRGLIDLLLNLMPRSLPVKRINIFYAFLDLSRNSGLQSIAVIHSELFQEGVPMSLNGWIPEMLSTIRSPTVTSVTFTLTDVGFCTDDVHDDDNTFSGGLSQVLDRMGCGRVDVLVKWTACRWYRDDNLELRYISSAAEGQSTPECDSEELTGRITHAIRSKIPELYRKGI
ncbi:hypothetical protein WOLCODRAFT_137859 [Wolfiporia cocos MD-104 SS10]|uniref:Uncharacterized protein n=1 Tax=Wolfiporia cocos (strain MD-104) TaxID=742152 RepID=A0A2H3JWW8_WOLCO|nr:hypothetical protein WOLCODRAFT_137859 [Wolfiporia cocos MD-104 SS10]